MLSDYQLRTIDASHGNQLRELMRRIYPAAYVHYWTDGGAWYLDSQYNQEKLERELAEPNAFYYLVERAGEPVGNLRLVHGRPSPERPDRPGTYLHRLYLAPEVQGTGLAARLLEGVLATAREFGDPYCWLLAMESQPQARRFYVKHDFQPGGAFDLDFERMRPELRGIRYYHRDGKAGGGDAGAKH